MQGAGSALGMQPKSLQEGPVGVASTGEKGSTGLPGPERSHL